MLLKGDYKYYLEASGEVGIVQKVSESMVIVEGLPGVKLGEVVVFEAGQTGQITALKKDSVEVLVHSPEEILTGEKLTRTGEKLKIGVGQQLLGLTVDALAKPIGKNPGGEMEYREVDIVPLGIAKRSRIDKQMVTGVTLVDMLIPVGKGQRELVMGDRKTGKSQFLLQCMISQSYMGSVCIYAAIAKRKTEILRLQNFFKEKCRAENIVLMVTSPESSTAEIFLCPYTAMTLAEFFRDRGRDVLIIFDDMSAHAQFYRELSLLSRKFPGRDSYPGDIFHIHSKLLERAGNFKVDAGAASITCLPIVETVAGDITGYIQTNLMSMTDGHIYFDSDLFFRGRRPAINPFISVTRVGHQTQTTLGRDIGRVLVELLANYEKTQSFLKFGAELGETSRQVLAMGDKLLAFFNQPLMSVIESNLQQMMLTLLVAGLWDGSKGEKMINSYRKDVKFRQEIDELLARHTNLNSLTGELRKNPDSWLRNFR